MKLISFCIPCYRSAGTVTSVVDEIRETMAQMKGYDYEIVLVNDASPDNTFDVIRDLAENDARITGVNLARNFGQHAALMAGYELTKGDIVVSLDDDGQTPANQVGRLLEAIEAGSDVVYARYDHKMHSGFRNLGSRLNDLMTCIMLGKPRKLYLSSYYAARRFVIDEMLKYKSSYPYVMGLVLRTTNKITNVDVDHRQREAGSSGYTFSKLLGLWMNGFTAFSVKPLRISTMTGIICALLGVVYMIYTIVRKFMNSGAPMGFPTLICVILFMGGMLMVMLGLVGEYVGRTYMSVNETPQYVVREVVGLETADTREEA
ncbi:undecaprenyl-phosphate 4-deoxy-4-formamido-L-arabinose transferase [Lachnospiraceae bacterium XBB2008]|nr:undecaprenyl-phosphate 4-deoxy-4-formamido-L-arabinose transferase [Lachnospiraceae bacterium XBB2008]